MHEIGGRQVKKTEVPKNAFANGAAMSNAPAMCQHQADLALPRSAATAACEQEEEQMLVSNRMIKWTLLKTRVLLSPSASPSVYHPCCPSPSACVMHTYHPLHPPAEGYSHPSGFYPKNFS
ncbi:hypothetical protein JOQ06_003886, partial [Pogonophryne albipinna]